MHILYDALRPYNVTSLTDPISITHFWTFSGTMMDFKLEPLEYLEETTGPTVTVEVNGLTFDMPVSWNVLAVEQDSYTVIPITHVLPLIMTYYCLIHMILSYRLKSCLKSLHHPVPGSQWVRPK